VSDTCSVRHRYDTDTYNYIKLYDFIKLLTVLVCQCPCCICIHASFVILISFIVVGLFNDQPFQYIANMLSCISLIRDALLIKSARMFGAGSVAIATKIETHYLPVVCRCISRQHLYIQTTHYHTADK